MHRKVGPLLLLVTTLATASCGSSQLASAPTPVLDINPASGLYALTLTLGPSCTILPDAERTRQYSARLADDGPGRYIVTLSDATFFEARGCFPLRCNQFRVVDEADTMRFILDPDNEFQGGYITEQTASGTWLTITGLLSAARHQSLIDASGTGDVGYCRTAGPLLSLCPDFVTCKTDIRLTFARK